MIELVGPLDLDAMSRDAAEWSAFAESLPPEMPLKEKVAAFREFKSRSSEF